MIKRYCYKCNKYTNHKDLVKCVRCERIYEREIFYIVESIDFYGKIKNDFKKIKLKKIKIPLISQRDKNKNNFLRKNEIILNSIYFFGKVLYEV